jgi:tetratricopeptide (TPR) repeat protein
MDLNQAPSCWLVALLLTGLLLGAGCRPEAAEQTMRPVPLLGLDGLAEAAQEQIRRQYTRTQAAAQTVPAEALGLEYGKLGQLLFTYDFLDAADSAFHNAAALRPEDETWLYYLGILSRQKGAFEDAAERFEQVLARKPDDVFARLRLAEALLETGRTDAAQAHLETALSQAPRNAFAHFLLGQIAYEADAFEKAAEHYETVLRLQPTATQVHTPLGIAYRNLGDEEQSRYHLDRRGTALVALNDPRVLDLEAFKHTSGATALTRGQQLIDAGRYQDAIAALEQAAAQDPSNPSVHLSLGVARSYAGDQPGAIAAFEEALRLDSQESKAHYNLGAIYAANGQPGLAEEHFRAAVAGDPRHKSANLELAEMLRRSGRCREAVSYFQQTLAIAPGDIAARQHLALCHLRLGEDTAARSLLEEGLAANPNHLGFIDALARVLAASPDADVRDGARALSLAERSMNLQRRTETLETLAMAHAELGRFDDAVTWQNQAVRAVENLRHEAYLAHLRENLDRYRQRLPCRTPWPDFMYAS